MRGGKQPLHPRPDLPQIFTNQQSVPFTEIDGGESSVLSADEPAGSYVLMCRIKDLGAQELYVAAQIEVTGTPSYTG